MRARLWLATAALCLGGAACIDSVASPTAPSRQPTGARFSETGSLTLLVCPTTETHQQTGVLGLLGGVLSLGNNALSLPFASVLLPTAFEVDVPASQYMEVDVHAVGLTSFLFHQPANITIDYSRCGDDAIPPGAQLRAVYIDSDTKAVLQDMGGTVDSVSHRITFTTGHLSGYAVAY